MDVFAELNYGLLSHTGPWMDIFGLGDAAKHIGTPQSIAIRNPDCAVATHLISKVSAQQTLKACGKNLSAEPLVK